MLDLLNFLDKSYTAHFAVKNLEELFKANDFTKINMEKSPILEKGGNYYIKKGETSIIGFKIGLKYENLGFNIVATHTDSPTLKIKPVALISGNLFETLNVEVYGGPILQSFLDRPLSLAGVVYTKEENILKANLVNIDEDLLIIPSVAIHLQRGTNQQELNPQIDLLPLLGQKSNTDFVKMIEEKANLTNIVSYDLYVYPRMKSTMVGLNKEYICSSRIDNLECTYLGAKSLVEANNEDKIMVFAAFDSEEVGSSTVNGANSTFLNDTLTYIYHSLGKTHNEYLSALEHSFIVSSDNAHSVHPNHPEKADPTNKVIINKGIVIKHNARGAYTTNALSWGVFASILDKDNVPYQHYTNRSDQRGGSTLGAISLSHVSINSVDIGLAQFAMHSAYETSGTLDAKYLNKGLVGFYNSRLEKIQEGFKF